MKTSGLGRWLLFVPVLSALPLTTNSQSAVALKRVLAWSSPGDEIITPRFSADGKLIVLVTRQHTADGHEAEGLPESYFKKLEERQRKEPRFADPVVRVINMSGQKVCDAEYGWNPSVSPDGKKIVYAGQKNPITGLRVLAETQAGNDIRVFDCESHVGKTVADPRVGYFDNPVFLPDGQSIVYSQSEAVNGDFGGWVGLKLGEQTGKASTDLLSKSTVPAVPCPSTPSAANTLQSFKCSQIGNLTSSFSQLLFQFALSGNQVLALVGTPIPAAGDMYMTETYDVNLLCVFPTSTKVLSFGKVAMATGQVPKFQVAPNERLMVFSQYWRPFDLAKAEWLPEMGPKNARRGSMYSPDLKYYVTTEPSEEPDHFTVWQTSNGRALYKSAKMFGVNEVAWSDDSKLLAVVGVLSASASAYREQLSVYLVP